MNFILPIELAGQLVLSLYLVLFLVGFKMLLARTGRLWPWLLLAPLFAYNFTFTTGFINFSCGIATGLFAVLVYLNWSERGRQRDAWGLAGLLLLTYLAHVLAWALWLVVIAAMAAGAGWSWRRRGALLLAMNSALPLLLLTRPNLAPVGLVIGPVIWLAFWLLRRLRVPWYGVAVGLVAIMAAAYRFLLVTRLPEPLQSMIFPYASYSRFDKQTIPLRLFTIPHQFAPPYAWLTGFNLAIVLLALLLIALSTWNAWQQRGGWQRPWRRSAVVDGRSGVVQTSGKATSQTPSFGPAAAQSAK